MSDFFLKLQTATKSRTTESTMILWSQKTKKDILFLMTLFVSFRLYCHLTCALQNFLIKVQFSQCSHTYVYWIVELCTELYYSSCLFFHIYLLNSCTYQLNIDRVIYEILDVCANTSANAPNSTSTILKWIHTTFILLCVYSYAYISIIYFIHVHILHS